MGADVLVCVADVANLHEVNRMFEIIDRRWGRIDVLVNNAGIEPVHSILDHPLEAWQRALDVNLTGSFLCTQQAARRMRAQGDGIILNIASIAGKSQPLYLRLDLCRQQSRPRGSTKKRRVSLPRTASGSTPSARALLLPP